MSAPDDHMHGGFPEQRAEPRDDHMLGWERLRDVPVCACGRAITVRGLCRICLHEQPKACNCGPTTPWCRVHGWRTTPAGDIAKDQER